MNTHTCRFTPTAYSHTTRIFTYMYVRIYTCTCFLCWCHNNYAVEGEEMLKKTVLRRTRALVTSQLPTRGDSPSLPSTCRVCGCACPFHPYIQVKVCVHRRCPPSVWACHTKIGPPDNFSYMTGPSESEG